MKRTIHPGMCVTGSFIWSFYRLFHDSHLVIDRDLSTAYSRPLSGNSVDLLSGTISTTKIAVIGVSQTTNLFVVIDVTLDNHALS